ncbi:MAG: efflux RND transporter periplasmic adaptor subunit [Pirellulales bacterium]
MTARGIVDFDPAYCAAVTNRCSGSIWRIFKEPGDEVRRGDLLAVIESGEAGKAKAGLLRTLARSELAEAELARKLKAASLLPERDLHAARAQQREARLQLFDDRQALVNLGFSLHLAELENLSDVERIRYMRLLDLPNELRSAPDADQLTANLVPLVAPLDGRVVRLNVTRGEAVHVNQARTLFVVADLHRLRVDLDVTPHDVARVALGAVMTFQPDGEGQDVSGRVTQVSPESDAQTQRVRVSARVSNPDGRLRLHAAGTGRITW